MNKALLNPAGLRPWQLLPVLAVLASPLAAQAQRYQALTVSGYTADVVANGTNLPVSSTISADFDGAGYNLMERGFSNNAGGVATQGLPPGGIINSALTAGLPFQLASYSASNSLRLPGGGASGTLTLAQPRAVNTLYVLGATGSGNATMDVTVRYTDGTTDFFGGNFVPDWFGGGNFAILGLGRTNPGGGIDNNSSDPRLYQTTLTISAAGRAKRIASVDFTNAGGGVLNVMGLSAESTSDLVISTAGQSVPVGNYTNITVTGPSGQGTITGPVQVQGALQVQSGGSLNTNCQALTGPGTFALQAGGTLGICDPAGIVASGATGAVQVTGIRSFASDANYVYNGVAAQATGSGLPAQVRNLTTTNANTVGLTGQTAVTQVVTVGGAGNLSLTGQTLTLLSSASGTALVVNSGTGAVTGTAIVQRYIDPSLNSGMGYRHYSAPVSNSSVADLATTGFTPEISQAATYNSSPTPNLVTPFPTVFAYDQSRVTLANAYAPFDRGFVVPGSTAVPLVVGRGYAVNLPASALVDFSGTLNNGLQTLNLTRNATGTANETSAGWQLLGNPYPSPLDVSLVANADRTGLDAASYVYSSTSQYAGQYRSFVNGVGGNPILPVAQGFFVRVSTGQTSATVNFRNSQRVTTPNATAFQRPTDVRPIVQLDLRASNGATDALYAYAETGATAGYDSQFDALKLPNSTGLNLASTASTSESLAIDGRPAFTTSTVLPLTVGVPAAGAFSITAAALTNIPTGVDAFLTDANTGQTVNLRTQATYAFSVSQAEAATLITGRFTLRFGARTALATASALTAADVAVYPNPAQGRFTVLVPAVAGAATVQAELLNALGQVVLRQTVAQNTAGAGFTVNAAGLATGVYTLRLHAGNASITKRVVLQ